MRYLRLLTLLALMLAMRGPVAAADRPTPLGKDHRSFKTLSAPAVPSISSDEQRLIRNPLDAFVLSKLSEKEMTFSPEADRRTLIRRLSYDLIGLPPSPTEVSEFVNDPDPHAYEKLVDRLLASPRYGERWARHWLDAVHYGDTHGYDKDKVRPNAWPYRDYVIRAFNEDKPYSRFVKEQLAGDYFHPGTTDGIAALGMIVAGPFDFVGQAEVRDGTIDKAITRNLDRDDMVTTTMNTLVSLTVQCARCHNHKFDPITQDDYYSLQAVFAGVDRAERPYDPDPKVAKLRFDLEQRLAHSSTEDRNPIRAKLNALPKPQMVFAATSEFSPMGTLTPTHGKARPIYILARGSEKSPGREVGPGTVAFLPDLPSRFDLPADAPEVRRRAALADWIVDLHNPLTWRSIVNRVWERHFGRGIVDTPNDFGRMGATPTHPELLDWLAVQFRDGGEWIRTPQSLKALHRLIVTSMTYRQSSSGNARNEAIDAGNQFLWRQNRQRLDAEAVRDTVLMVSGRLDLTMGGPGFLTCGFEDDHSPRYKYAEFDPDTPASLRRSVYRLTVRSVPDPFMESLDCADASQLVPRRNETLTALQALALLNDKFMLRMSEHFADRVRTGSPGDLAGEINAAYQVALCRPATADEIRMLSDLARKDGMPNVCRVIFNCNEFLYVD